jgi:hypothetical protein
MNESTISKQYKNGLSTLFTLNLDHILNSIKQLCFTSPLQHSQLFFQLPFIPRKGGTTMDQRNERDRGLIGRRDRRVVDIPVEICTRRAQRRRGERRN